MADRDYYYLLEFRRDDLKGVDEATEFSSGVVASDLRSAEKQARNVILSKLTALVGWSAASAWDADWRDETETYPDHVPPMIRLLAQKYGSAYAHQKLERYDRRVQQHAEGEEILVSSVLLTEAEKVWEMIVASGILIFDDGTAAIDMTDVTDSTGIGVGASGPVFFGDVRDNSWRGQAPPFSAEELFEDPSI